MTITAEPLARIRVKAEHMHSGHPYGISTHPDPEGDFARYEQAEARVRAVENLANQKVLKAKQDADDRMAVLRAKLDAYQVLVDDAGLIAIAQEAGRAAGLKDGNIRKHHRSALKTLGVKIEKLNTEESV